LTISGLSKTNSIVFDKSATVLPALVNLNVTGKAATSGPYISTQTNAVSVTSDVLTDITTAGTIDAVRLHGASKLVNLTSSGFTREYQLLGAAKITTVAMGHDHIEGSDAASLRISGATKLTTLAPTALDEVGFVTLTSLPAMTSLNLGSMVTLPILGTYTMTISATGLTGSYGIATEATTTTAAYTDKIYSDDLMTLSPLMTLATASSAVTYVFEGDIISIVATRSFDADGVAGASSTSTRSLANVISDLGGSRNAASAITTPVSNLDFAHVAAE
jgi:hypothetical protein